MDAHTMFTLTHDQVEMQHSARMNKSVKLHLERHDTQTSNAEEGLVTVSKVSSHIIWVRRSESSRQYTIITNVQIRTKNANDIE